MVTVQTKVGTLQFQYSANSDAYCSFLVVKCASSCLPRVHTADDHIDHSFRDFASWGTVLPLSMLLLS